MAGIGDTPGKRVSDECAATDTANRPKGPEHPSPSAKPRQRTLRFRLASLVLACVLPVCAIAGLVVYHAYQQKRALLEQRVLETARALSMVVDRELAAMQASTTALATSDYLASGDLAGFYRQAQEVLHDYPGATFTLADATGQQLVNTFVPFGTPLPKRTKLDLVARVFETGKPVIVNLFKANLLRVPIVGVEVPVIRDGRIVYDLALVVPANRFSAVLSQQSIPPGWPATILDANRVVIARDRLEQSYVGLPAVPALIKALSETADGRVETTNRAGVPIVTMFSRSAKSGWAVGIGIPKAVMLAEIRQWLWWTTGGAILFSTMGIALALFLARRISGSIQALTGPALALGSGEPVAVGQLDLAETNEVGQSLVKASQLLQQRTAERERAEQALRESEEKFRRLVDQTKDHAIFMLDPDGRVTSWNSGAQSIKGYTESEIIGRDMSCFYVPEDIEQSKPGRLLRVAAEHDLAEDEGWRVRKDGSRFWAEVTLSALRDDSGRILGFSNVTRDITEHSEGGATDRPSRQFPRTECKPHS